MNRQPGWTGGQYSLYRLIFGSYLAVHFLHLRPWAAETFSSAGMVGHDSSPLLRCFPNVLGLIDSPWFVVSLVTVAAAASVAFAVGWHDRFAGILIWYVLACLFGRNPLTLNPSMPFVGWLLIAHLFVPRSPTGAISAKGRLPGVTDWYLPTVIFRAAWIIMALAYSYSGYTKLISPSWIDGSALAMVMENPLARPTAMREWILSWPTVLIQVASYGALALELLFAPLALWGKARPYLWTAMLTMHVGILLTVDFADLTIGMLIVHLFTFDPRWLRPAAPGSLLVFFDDACGLCHRSVRFLLAEDAAVCQFAFQGGDIAGQTIQEAEFANQDSLIVRRSDGQLRSRSNAVVECLWQIGGMWRVLGGLLWCVPRPLRDAGYILMATIRHRLFPTPTALCPLLPANLQSRFLT
jgi:predicted DCC family thiol-disulfide oxidoreductase YuxK